MNKLISSTLLTVVAVPFLMAAPAATKVQNTTTPAPAKTAPVKTKTKHVKKAKSAVASTDAAAPASTPKK